MQLLQLYLPFCATTIEFTRLACSAASHEEEISHFSWASCTLILSASAFPAEAKSSRTMAFWNRSAYFQQRMPTKAETRALEESINSKYSPPISPLIERRPLSPTTEAELKAACAAVARDYQPAANEPDDYRVVDAKDEQLAKARRQEAALREYRSRYVNSKFDAFPSTAPQKTHSIRHTYSLDPTLHEVVRESYESQSRHVSTVSLPRETRQLRSSQTAYPQRRSSLLPTPAHVEAELTTVNERRSFAPLEERSDSSSSTPKTGSTDHRFGNPSTDITSANWTTPSSRHTSTIQLPAEQAASLRADVQASEWMKQETVRRKSGRDQQEVPHLTQTPRSRSRGRSFRDEIRDYMRPRSTSRSQTPSGEQDPSAPKPSISSSGWKSWGFQKRMSNSQLFGARPGSTTSLADVVGPDRKKREVDLNRELPPLPGLDQWKDPAEEKANGMHIAALMRTNSKGHRKSRSTKYSESMPNLLPNDASRADSIAIAHAMPIRAFQGARTESQASTRISTREGSRSNIDFSRSNPNLVGPVVQDGPARAISPMAHHDNRSHHALTSPMGDVSVRASRHIRQATSSSSGSGAPNFSRKLSTEQNGHAFGITALPSVPPPPPTPVPEKKGLGLRKMFSTIGKPKATSRPGSKGAAERAEGNWMSRIESNGGIRGGILEVDEAAGAPVIRY